MGAPDKLVSSIGAGRPNGIGPPSFVVDPRAHDRETLRAIIAQWNANRLDLFELSEPDENMEFHGVMRFYFQEDGQKIATKCVRVSSLQTARQVVDVLVEKFRPDMRMLSVARYGLHEVHANGEERRLRDEEKPLLVQLNWHKDDREGRFLLKNEDEPRRPISQNGEKDFKRRLSKREKKELKKKEKEEKLKAANEEIGVVNGTENDAERLFKQLPETSFHRSISNPEAVMRRRRQQKLEKKLQQFKSKDGGPDTGGTLKIFGETINRDVPYKTLLLSVNDTVETVIKQSLEKYGLERDDFSKYCLVQAVLPPNMSLENGDPGLTLKETVLTPTDCPLQILMHFPREHGTLVFNLKKRPSPAGNSLTNGMSRQFLAQNPYLIEALPTGMGQALQLFPGILEVGNDHSRLGAANFFHLTSPDVLPIHCVFHRSVEGIVLVSPFIPTATVFVDGRKVDSATPLHNGSVIRIGQSHVFRLCVPQSFNAFLNDHAAPREKLNREKLQLPLTSVAQPKKPSPDSDARKLPQMMMQESLEAEMMDTNSSITYSHRSTPEMHLMSRQNAGMNSKLPILPVTLEFREDREEAFLYGVIVNCNPTLVNFKLSPTYVLYMAARYRASTNFRPEVVPLERAHLLTRFLKKVASVFLRQIEEHQSEAEYLAFWMTNSSELLHLLKLDRHMSPYGADAHDILTECVRLAFHHLVQCQQEILQNALPGLFTSERDSEITGWGNVLNTLSTAMFLLRRCRLNAALTIQLFSQLFHYINMWLFNSLVHHPERCNRHFGNWLRGGLDNILRWAEKQGLELAADCHLSKIIQATNLLVMPKMDENPTSYTPACYRLNSFQVRYILENYEPSSHEHPLASELIDGVAAVARSLVDDSAELSGQKVQLEEEPDLNIPFLIPEDGYSVDVVCGVPTGLQDFLEPLTRNKICEMSVHPFSQGSWSVYLTPSSGDRSPSTSYDGGRQMHPTQHLPNIVIEVAFPKGNSGIGLSIVAARSPAHEKLGIYIKSVVKGGAADQDGRLQSGDQLLKVNGKGLIGVTQDRAAELIAQSGATVQLEVLKQGAIANGVATLLNSPSPPPPGKFIPNSSSLPTKGFAYAPETRGSINGHGTNGNQYWPHETATLTRVPQLPSPSCDRSPVMKPPVSHSNHHDMNDGQRFYAVGSAVRAPSPIREAIASQMHQQRDKLRQDAKLFEMEDELRRRREVMQMQQQMNYGSRSPVSGSRPPPPNLIVARSMANGNRSTSSERLNGRPPVEKRVQWALDSPKKSPSPTLRQPGFSSQPDESQVVTRIPVLPSPSTTPTRPQLAQEIQSWAKGFRENEPNTSPSNSPWQRDDYQRLKQLRVNDARRFRDEEIDSLQSRMTMLSSNEEERLRTLLLERDFQRRADETIHHGDEELDEDDEDDDDGEEPDNNVQIQMPFISTKSHLVKLTPHLHHPIAAAAPEVYKTRQQEDHDRFVRRHEVHAANEAVRRSREKLDTVRFQEPPLQHEEYRVYSYPELNRRSVSPAQMEYADAVPVVKRQTAGAEIRNEVELSRSADASVVGVHEIYNDPRNRILNAKVRPPVYGNDMSPEKLSFKDKMRMFAVTETAHDKVMSSSKQREIDTVAEYS